MAAGIASQSSRAWLGLCGLILGSWSGDGFVWDRDRVFLKNGKEERGVVIESCHPDRILLLRHGNRREEIRRGDIRRIDLLRDRLAAFVRVRRQGLSIEAEWGLVEDAKRAGLEHMARLQAYHVLLRDPEHRSAHEFLGHERASSGWRWAIDGKPVTRDAFEDLSADWNHRLVLESEHFLVETNCGLRRGLDVLFDLEGLYVWWMENLGPALRAAEDVDDPEAERITFLVHTSRADPSFLQRTSEEDAYYDPSQNSDAASGSFNVARTYYATGGERPELLFELGTEALLFSTLVLGRTRDEADDKIRRLSHWADIGLGCWVARHCGGSPGYPEIRPPFRREFLLDPETARMSLERIAAPHHLLRGWSELANLVDLPYLELVGRDPNTLRARARACSFVSFLLEAQPAAGPDEKTLHSGRDALWTYFREVYCTQKAYSSSAFDDGLVGAKVESLEGAWKAWTASFVN